MITIRRAQVDDAAALARLAEHTFRETFTTADNLTDMTLYCAKTFAMEIQRQEILSSNRVTLLVEVSGQLIAYAQIRLHAPKDCVVANHPSELQRLYVEKAWHGRGVAHQIMAQVLSVAASAGSDQLWLGAWEHNPRAIAFYRKYGFSIVGEHIFQFGHELQRDLVMKTPIPKPLSG